MARVDESGVIFWNLDENRIQPDKSEIFERHSTIFYGVAIILRHYAIKGEWRNLIEFIRLLDKASRSALNEFKKDGRSNRI